jgi:hypothetical protein
VTYYPIGDLLFAPHAVRRYIERHAPDASFEEALAQLAGIVPALEVVRGSPRHDCDEHLRAGEVDVVVKHDVAGRVAVTVLRSVAQRREYDALTPAQLATVRRWGEEARRAEKRRQLRRG